MKPIKFDLLINGTKVKNIQELRDNFTAEILKYLRDGRLAKWLQTRDMNSELLALNELKEIDDHALPKKLCQIFKIEADDFMTSAIVQVAPLEQVAAAMQQIEIEAEAISAEHIVLNSSDNPPLHRAGIGTFRMDALYAYISAYDAGKRNVGAVSSGGLVYSRVLPGDNGEPAAPAYEWLASSRNFEMLGQRLSILLDGSHERYKLSGSQARKLDAVLTESFNRVLNRQLSISKDVLELGSFSNDIVACMKIMSERPELAATIPAMRKIESDFIANHTLILTGQGRQWAIENYDTLLLPRQLSDKEKETIELSAYPALAVLLAVNANELAIDIDMGQSCALVLTEHKQLATLVATLVDSVNPLTKTHSRIALSTLDGYRFELDKGLLGNHYYLITRCRY